MFWGEHRFFSRQRQIFAWQIFIHRGNFLRDFRRFVRFVPARQLGSGGARVLHAQGNVRRDQQMETLADIIQTALMLRINKRRVGRAVLMEYSEAVKCAYE